MGRADPGPGDPVKLNLGCGDRYAVEWWNVDHRACPHRKDAAVDLAEPLPWPPATLTHVYAGHILEHLGLDTCALLLARLLPCMAPGGALMVVGPDLIRAQAMAEAGTLDVTMDSLRYGASRWPGDEHQWECTPGVVIRLLAACGWADVTEIGINDVDPMWPVADRRPQWQCAISARRSRE
jgi:hypothetical protein